ncbi:hypothetical protein DB30_00549 [Enhygromyxa salina]|uniref:J domain-containing protein n=1 Tax=Enhygromyxa salina TaxID=215803 RepID=A0A0C1Z618_9BACT|nr:DnaJ domain-containing protein [Enhygromyxa salina]KIG13084.1 hypothetical protein DB30_00549 [Enhygromyxa salina]
MPRPDYYELLGVGPEADTDEVLRAYQRELANRDPDTPDPARARLVDAAFAVLSDPVARAEYDATCVGHDLIDETAAAITKVGPPVLGPGGQPLGPRDRELLDDLRRKAAAARRARKKS